MKAKTVLARGLTFSSILGSFILECFYSITSPYIQVVFVSQVHKCIVEIGIVPGSLFCSSNVTDGSLCRNVTCVYSIKCVYDTLLDIHNKLIQNYKTFFECFLTRSLLQPFRQTRSLVDKRKPTIHGIYV